MRAEYMVKFSPTASQLWTVKGESATKHAGLKLAIGLETAPCSAVSWPTIFVIFYTLMRIESEVASKYPRRSSLMERKGENPDRGSAVQFDLPYEGLGRDDASEPIFCMELMRGERNINVLILLILCKAWWARWLPWPNLVPQIRRLIGEDDCMSVVVSFLGIGSGTSCPKLRMENLQAVDDGMALWDQSMWLGGTKAKLR